MSAGEKYLFGAYAVVFAAVLAYVVIIALKLGRLDRELAELAELARERKEEREVDEAAQPPVRDSGPVEGVRGNREVPPGTRAASGG